jgi:hypothetical protein
MHIDVNICIFQNTEAMFALYDQCVFNRLWRQDSLIMVMYSSEQHIKDQFVFNRLWRQDSMIMVCTAQNNI